MRYSYRAIAQAVGTSKTTVWRDLNSPEMAARRAGAAGGRVIGIDGKSYPAVPGEVFPSPWLLEMRGKGMSYRAIAAETGVSHQTIMRMFRRLVQVSQAGQVNQ